MVMDIYIFAIPYRLRQKGGYDGRGNTPCPAYPGNDRKPYTTTNGSRAEPTRESKGTSDDMDILFQNRGDCRDISLSVKGTPLSVSWGDNAFTKS